MRRWKGGDEVNTRRGGYGRGVFLAWVRGGAGGGGMKGDGKIERVKGCMLWEVNPGWALLPFLWYGGDVGLRYRWERCVWVATWGNPFTGIWRSLKGFGWRVYICFVGRWFGYSWDDGDDAVD